jgi:hypothetical protein
MGSEPASIRSGVPDALWRLEVEPRIASRFGAPTSRTAGFAPAESVAATVAPVAVQRLLKRRMAGPPPVDEKVEVEG